MNINRIVDNIVDITDSLYSPLLKAKVLASRISNKELLTWVNKEIDGYEYQDDQLPSYRTVRCSTFCTIQQGYSREYNQPFPISFVPDEVRKQLQKFHLYESIVSLETYIKKNDPEGQLSRKFPVDFSSAVTQEVRKRGGDFILSDVRVITGVAEVNGAIAAIRNKLLSLLLEIQGNTKGELTIETLTDVQIKSINNTINYYMADKMYNNSHNIDIQNYGGNTNIAANNKGDVKQNINIQADNTDLQNLVSKLQLLKDSLEEVRPQEFIDEQIIILQQEIEQGGKKPNPGVIKGVLDKLNGFMWSIAANAYTEPILEIIQKIG
jgi:hypothetical protein